MLVAWKAIADQSWIHRTTVGTEQKNEDHLQGLKLGSSVVERVAYRNYARVLEAALTAA